MIKTLYRITDPKGFPAGAAWIVLSSQRVDASNTSGETHTVTVGVDVAYLNLYGDVLQRSDPPPRKAIHDTLVSVGSFQDDRGMIDLMTPTLVQMAHQKLADCSLLNYQEHSACLRALSKQSYENACWILKATPEELQSWAAALTRKPT